MSQSFAVPLANTRNVTIVAHVDHGKTSFADSLLSSNNIISSRMAGKLRFLDSREDEQERGITMESSAVSLRFDMNRIGPDGTASTSKHLCNVIDTPGHVDFASEVSTASRLCDGALVLVDCWEGVCTQTIAVLRQAWVDRLRPLLVINKIDRLITELQMSPSEAYHHLSQLIEQVNAVMGSFYASERMEDDLRWREEREKRLAARQSAQEEQNDLDIEDTADIDKEFEEKEDEDIYFAPDRGNVLFASAIDGWAFRLGKFARLYAEKLKIKESNLRRVLWGDWYLDPKTKRVVGRKKLAGRNLKPLFVQFVLENIWRVYDTVLNQHDPEATQKIVTALGVRVTPRDIRSKDTRNLLNIIMQQWLPLSTATFQAVIDVIPSPSDAQAIRLPFMLHPEKAAASNTALIATNELEKGLYGCDQSENANVVAYVSKMFAVERGDLPEFKPKEMTAEEMRQRGKEEREKRAALLASRQEIAGANANGVPLPENGEDLVKPLDAISLIDKGTEAPLIPIDESSEVLLGFSRIFSGVLKRNTPLIVTLPKYENDLGPTHPKNAKHVFKVIVKDLYMMMGRELVSVEEVPAGHVCAIGGLERVVPRSATLWAPNAQGVEDLQEDTDLVNLAGVNLLSAPIVRVALEPENPSDMPKLIRGLQILNQADPCAEYLVQETGEHVIITAGEIHLQRCIKDLQERFAKCRIQQSAVIVPFRESAVKAPDMLPPKTAGAPRGTVHGSILNGLVTFTIRAIPLPPAIIEMLLSNTNTIGSMLVQKRDQSSEDEENQEERDVGEGGAEQSRTMTPEQFWSELEGLMNKAGGDWAGAADRVWSFGPKRMGANVLLDPAGKSQLRYVLKASSIASANETDDNARAELRLLRDFENSIEAGFQMATFQGPLCSEPVVGMAWVVENVELNKEEFESEQGKGRTAAVTGALISSVRDACRAGMLDWSPRIKLAMYTCDIQASTDVLGKVYAVVARRRGRIVSEEMKEGTSFFTIRAMLPVVESFGFADEIRKRTSGAASPQLIFSGFETLDQDPFWVPTTQEELEDLGEKADRANVAKGYVDGVRKRKGMFVERKIVEFAEKQRTLKK
uniref:Ribosome assembly protein 1 n=1 Tax=Kwoniella bestiolae CBS 10118 TaxID=1296100 RepID=A0A1B9G1X3_9TREE|nr:ribosome assembly protein 1 [Kwoniella bestiolae CBS 10118]OCF25015.1 ribosome assembly protein 1 [Kwoniella bestiolae CBS 10118]